MGMVESMEDPGAHCFPSAQAPCPRGARSVRLALLLQANAPRDLPRNFSLSELADLGDLDGGSKEAASGS